MSHVEKSERKVGRGESRREGVTQSDGEFREQGCETVRFCGSSERQNLLLGSYRSTRLRIGNVDATVGKGMWWSTEEQ